MRYWKLQMTTDTLANILTQSDTLITNTHTHDTIRSQRNKDKKKQRDGNSEIHTQLYQEE